MLRAKVPYFLNEHKLDWNWKLNLNLYRPHIDWKGHFQWPVVFQAAESRCLRSPTQKHFPRGKMLSDLRTESKQERLVKNSFLCRSIFFRGMSDILYLSSYTLVLIFSELHNFTPFPKKTFTYNIRLAQYLTSPENGNFSQTNWTRRFTLDPS